MKRIAEPLVAVIEARSVVVGLMLGDGWWAVRRPDRWRPMIETAESGGTDGVRVTWWRLWIEVQ